MPYRPNPRASVVPAVVLSAAVAALPLGLAAAQPAEPASRISADELMTWVRRLSSPEFEGRRSGTEGNVKARAVIANRLRALRIAPIGDEPSSYIRAFPLTGKTAAPDSTTPLTNENRGANIVGLCRGTGPAGGPAMVISAHYDHLGIRDGVLYPGADDNASGVAAVLALAQWCAKTPWTHDAVFAFFDAEERGLLGARAFVASPPIPESRIALNVNLDMVSRSGRRELYAAGTSRHPELAKVLARVAGRAGVSLKFGHDYPSAADGPMYDWTLQSDHGAFHGQGIPFVYFGVEDHEDYHKPGDTADKIDPEFFRHAAETILDSIDALDRWLPSRR
jgi:Zn-dependent M28 family amino/carboxypeptidase